MFDAKKTGKVARIVLAGMAALYLLTAVDCAAVDKSPDGRFEASRVTTDTGIHFQVKEVSTGKVMLTTRARWSTWNDCKAGRFYLRNPNELVYGCLYHYGDGNARSYVAAYSVATGKQLRTCWLDGWQYSIPDSAFEEDE